MKKFSILPQIWVLAGLMCLSASSKAADSEILLFPTVAGLHRDSPTAHHPQDELEPSIDGFYTASHERLRFLAEFFLTKDHEMMERMQIGWLPTSSATIWLGRFHNPLGYWNTQFHHGNYMTTTITRPGIVAFEEHGGGVLPMHISGLLLEETGDSTINYSVALGVGPALGIAGLEPVNILKPTDKHGRLAASARLSYRPDAGKMDEFGVFAARTRIPADNLSMTMLMGSMVMSHPVFAVTQTLVGAELHQTFERLSLTGELFIVRDRVEAHNGTSNQIFSSGYLQADYSIQPEWTLFGRLEDTADATGNIYLDLRHDFVKSRALAGARYSLSSHQALKFEVARSELQDNSQFNQIGVEWSAIFP